MPPKKRKRDNPSKSQEEKSNKLVPTRTEVKSVFNELLQDIDDQANLLKSPKILARFLVLKQWQRSLLDRLQTSTAELQEAATHHEQAALAAQAVEYEEAHVQRQLLRCQDVTLPHLEALAKEELGSDVSEDNLLLEFLAVDVKDPSNRQRIIARLHQEWNARGGLERDLKIKQQELKTVKDELKQQQSFLDALPDHLTSMERASASLHKAMSKNPGSSKYSPHLTRMTGPERKARLDMAKSLPAPLYTLYQQVQYVLDRPWTLPSCSKVVEMTLSVSSSGEYEADKQVVLHMPVPDVVSAQSRSKRVAVHFYYDQDMAVVTAAASGCGTTLNQDVLLDELFPNDSPQAATDAAPKHVSGRPFHWCNVLAGLHGADPTTLAIQTASARVIIQQLQRRIRANATLKHVLHSLHRLVVPVPPGAERLVASAKLTHFSVQEDHAVGNEKVFAVSVRKGDAEKSGTVRFNLARYPNEPPMWSWTGSESLYHTGSMKLERYINVDGLDQMVGGTTESPDTGPGDETHSEDYSKDDAQYEWILVHQMREILQRYDIMDD